MRLGRDRARVGLGERQERPPRRGPPGSRGSARGGRRHDHVARARALGGAGHQRARPRSSPRDPATTRSEPLAFLWPSIGALGQTAASTSRGLGEARAVGDELARGTRCRPRARRPRARRRAAAPCRSSARRTSPSGRRGPRRPPTAPVAPSTPLGMSTATTGRGAASSASIASAHSPSGAPAEPGPEDRVDRDVGPRARAERAGSKAAPASVSRRVGRGCRPPARGDRPEQQHDDPHPPRARVPGGDQPVAAVVPLAAHDDRAPAVGAAEQVEARPRHRPHRRAPSAPPPASRRPGSRRSSSPASAGVSTGLIASVTATANATAFVFSCVKVIRTRVMPSASARALRVAGQRDDRRAARVPGHADVLPPLAAVAAERLDHGLAGREPARVDSGRTGLRVAVGDLLGREHAGAHRGVPGERPLHPRDLADVDAEADDLHAPRLAAGHAGAHDRPQPPAARRADRCIVSIEDGRPLPSPGRRRRAARSATTASTSAPSTAAQLSPRRRLRTARPAAAALGDADGVRVAAAPSRATSTHLGARQERSRPTTW